MKGWLQLSAQSVDSRSATAFLRDAIALLEGEQSRSHGEGEEYDADSATAALVSRASQLKDQDDRQWCVAMSGVLLDLVQQGWRLAYERKHLWGQRPEGGMPREVLRERMLIRRDEQLRKASVRQFVHGMEAWRLFRGQRASIVSLLRDGRALSAELSKGASLSDLVDPYLQFVVTNGICDLTGMRTQDIWRYFRHTWSSPYESVPGRSLQFLVRDRSAPLHPIVGIGALSSAAVRLGPRDRFIGWDTDAVVARMQQGEYGDAGSWVRRVLADALTELYTVDLVRDSILPADQRLWTLETATRLLEVAADAKAQHHRLMDAQEYKGSPDVSSETACIARAEMPLFRAKRALELSKIIRLGIATQDRLPEGSEGRDVLSQVVRIARSKTVGTEIADLTVCGAIAPYSHLGAGKLIAMLATSPEVIAEYRRRYAGTPGIIASSMAGRPIGRQANLCFIGTTSLYGRRPNQYDRLAMPATVVGGTPGEFTRYAYIQDQTDSRTRGMGSFHFSSKTLKGLELYASSGRGGWKANNLFGEGSSPKLRGLRDGLLALGLQAQELLVHGIERCMYGAKLATNVDRYLLGLDAGPHWIFGTESAASSINSWWIGRWGEPRAARAEIRTQIQRESLAHPIRHHGRVRLPDAGDGQKEL
jgi:Domain of unknown function (DUF4338)